MKKIDIGDNLTGLLVLALYLIFMLLLFVV
jgi:hypothetical protein